MQPKEDQMVVDASIYATSTPMLMSTGPLALAKFGSEADFNNQMRLVYDRYVDFLYQYNKHLDEKWYRKIAAVLYRDQAFA